MSDYKQTSVQDEDEDVAAERQKMYEGGRKTDVLQIRDLSKVNTVTVSVTSSQPQPRVTPPTVTDYTCNVFFGFFLAFVKRNLFFFFKFQLCFLLLNKMSSRKK